MLWPKIGRSCSENTWDGRYQNSWEWCKTLFEASNVSYSQYVFWILAWQEKEKWLYYCSIFEGKSKCLTENVDWNNRKFQWQRTKVLSWSNNSFLRSFSSQTQRAKHPSTINRRHQALLPRQIWVVRIRWHGEIFNYWVPRLEHKSDDTIPLQRLHIGHGMPVLVWFWPKTSNKYVQLRWLRKTKTIPRQNGSFLNPI